MTEIKKFTLYRNTELNYFVVVLTDSIKIPYYHDGCACLNAFNPIDFTDPKEYEYEYDAVIAHNTHTQQDVIININEFEFTYKEVTEDDFGCSIFLDHGSCHLRNQLGLMTFEIKDKDEKLLFIKKWIDELIELRKNKKL